MQRKSVFEAKKAKRKWRLTDANWDDFQVCLSEESWDTECLLDVNDMNGRLTENVRNIASNTIGFVRMDGRKRKNKPWWNEEIKLARQNGRG